MTLNSKIGVLWIFLAISCCDTSLYHSQDGTTELLLCDPDREFGICIHINLAWTLKFLAKLLNQNCYRLSRISWALAQISCLTNETALWNLWRDVHLWWSSPRILWCLTKIRCCSKLSSEATTESCCRAEYLLFTTICWLLMFLCVLLGWVADCGDIQLTLQSVSRTDELKTAQVFLSFTFRYCTIFVCVICCLVSCSTIMVFVTIFCTVVQKLFDHIICTYT